MDWTTTLAQVATGDEALKWSLVTAVSLFGASKGFETWRMWRYNGSHTRRKEPATWPSADLLKIALREGNRPLVERLDRHIVATEELHQELHDYVVRQEERDKLTGRTVKP